MTPCSLSSNLTTFYSLFLTYTFKKKRKLKTRLSPTDSLALDYFSKKSNRVTEPADLETALYVFKIFFQVQLLRT